MKNCISINLKKDTIIVKVSENATQEEIKECLKKKIEDLKELYKDEKTPIQVVGKVLNNAEIDEIKEIINDILDVKVDFESPRTLGLHGIKKAFSREIKSSDTKFQKGSVRSGQKLEYEGSIVVIGDVNGGAEVIAGENIIVLGSLRGLAHAGAKGNKEAIIAANQIDCPQIRISNVIKEIERKETENENESAEIKTYAYINDEGELVLE